MTVHVPFVQRRKYFHQRDAVSRGVPLLRGRRERIWLLGILRWKDCRKYGRSSLAIGQKELRIAGFYSFLFHQFCE